MEELEEIMKKYNKEIKIENDDDVKFFAIRKVCKKCQKEKVKNIFYLYKGGLYKLNDGI